MLTPDEAAADLLPMWVADMDFRAPQPVIDALVEAAQEGMFGYPNGATKAMSRPSRTGRADGSAGRSRRNGWCRRPASSPRSRPSCRLLRAGRQRADPAAGYAHFRDDVLLNGRFPVDAPLPRTEDGYRYDEKIFEAAIRPNTKIFILSHPHNPTGNVWSEAELRSMGEICARHGILVVADETHQDLIINTAAKHIPFAVLKPGLSSTRMWESRG